MDELCAAGCCSRCDMKGSACSGCKETDGHPYGGTCVAVECIRKGGFEAFCALKQSIMEHINALGMKDLQVSEMYLLSGSYVNLAYVLPNGQTVKLLDDHKVYFANQVERPGSERCYGIAADENYLLVCEYGCGGSKPEILLYQKMT